MAGEGISLDFLKALVFDVGVYECRRMMKTRLYGMKWEYIQRRYNDQFKASKTIEELQQAFDETAYIKEKSERRMKIIQQLEELGNDDASYFKRRDLIEQFNSFGDKIMIMQPDGDLWGPAPMRALGGMAYGSARNLEGYVNVNGGPIDLNDPGWKDKVLRFDKNEVLDEMDRIEGDLRACSMSN